MKPAKFDEIAENIEELGNAYIGFAASHQDQGTLRWDQGWRDKLRSSYEQEIKPSLKMLSADDEHGFVDRHKIAAALALAVIRRQPLIASFGNQESKLVREANRLLSVDTGALVLFAFGAEESALTNNAGLAQIYDSASGFEYPAPGNGDTDYRLHFCQTLRLVNQTIHPLLFAHVFFLLQRHFEAWRAAELRIDIGALDPVARRKALEPFLASSHA